MNEPANSSHAHDFGPPRLGKQTGPAEYETYFEPCPCGLTWEVYLKQKVRGFNARNPGLELTLGAGPAEGNGAAESPPANARPFADLSTAGILWAINRALLHPRGYALALHRDQDGNAIGWSLKGDGREPWIFEASVDEDRHFADFERLLREQSLGLKPDAAASGAVPGEAPPARQAARAQRTARNSDVAAAFGIGTATVQRYAREGRIPYSLTPGGHRRYNINEVHRALRNWKRAT